MAKNDGVFQPKRVLIVVKQTLKALVTASNDDRLKNLLGPDSEDRERIERSDQEHNLTLSHVVDILTDRGITSRCVNREPGEHFSIDGEEMIVTIGGDGTFLDASHSVLSRVPMLGVNSAPLTSFGHFCLTDRTGFEAVLDSILSGARKPCSLLRLKISLDDETIDMPVLNEVMVAHPNPAGTSRYRIEALGTRAEQKSSGLLITTPSGSTGFMRSNGGPILDITDSQIAFWTRDPFKRPGEDFPLRSGTVKRGDKIVVTSEMIEGKLYIDGAHIERDFLRGSKFTVTAHEADLIAYVDPRCHDRYKPAA